MDEDYEFEEDDFEELDESVHDADSSDSGNQAPAGAGPNLSQQRQQQPPPPQQQAAAPSQHGGQSPSSHQQQHHHHSASNYSMSFEDDGVPSPRGVDALVGSPHPPPAAASPPSTPSPRHQRGLYAAHYSHQQQQLSPQAVRPQQRPVLQQQTQDNSYSSDFDVPSSPLGSQHSSSVSGSYHHFSPKQSSSLNNLAAKHHHHRHNNISRHLPAHAVPAEIHSMRDIVRRIVAQGAGDKETRLLERHLSSLQAGLQDLKLKRAEEQRKNRLAAQDKKQRAEARRFQHIESLAQANKRAAAAEYECKKLGQEKEELRRMLEMAESEAGYAKEALDVAERAKAAAERLLQDRDRQLRTLREDMEDEVEDLKAQWEEAAGRARRMEVEADKARAVWAVERDGVVEAGRVEVVKARQESRAEMDELQLARQKLVVEVEVLRASQERQERRMEEERRALPHVHKEMLDKEEARLHRLEAGLEEERASLDCERARFMEEMEAWRRKMEDEERQARARMAGIVEEAKREREAQRSAFEDERRSSRQELMVLEMKAEQAQATAARDKAAAEKERQRLAEESALLAVRAGLLAPQLQELDRAYEEVEGSKKDVERRDVLMSEERARLDGLYKELTQREQAVRKGLEEATRLRCESAETRRDKKALHVARLELHEAFVQLSRQSHEVRRAVALLRRVTSILPTPDPYSLGNDEDEAYNYGSLIDAVTSCIEDAGAVRLPRGLIAPLGRAARGQQDDDDDEEDEDEDDEERQLVPVDKVALAWREEEEGEEDDISFFSPKRTTSSHAGDKEESAARTRARKGDGDMTTPDKTEELLVAGGIAGQEEEEEVAMEEEEYDGQRGPPSASPPRTRVRRRRLFSGNKAGTTSQRREGDYQYTDSSSNQHSEDAGLPIKKYLQGLRSRDMLSRPVAFPLSSSSTLSATLTASTTMTSSTSSSSSSSWRHVLKTEEDHQAQAGYRRAATLLNDKVEALRAVTLTGGATTSFLGSHTRHLDF